VVTDTDIAPAGDAERLAWIRDRAIPIATLDARAPLDDLELFRAIVDGARVVGFGEATRFAHELFAVRFRLLRWLVEAQGFRALALEVDWTKGCQLDEYVRTGHGNPRALLDEDAWGVWHTEEFVDTLHWMRSYNQRNAAEPVRVVGIDYDRLQARAYDAVLDYLRRHARDHLAGVAADYAVLRPSGTVADQIEWITSHPDKRGLVERARGVEKLIAGLSKQDGHALASWNARLVAGFYGYHADEGRGTETLMADGVIRWQSETGQKIAYWGGTAHTAVHRPEAAPASTPTWHTEGTYLRDHFGPDYVSIALTFDHGRALWDVAPCSSELAEAVLREVAVDAFGLDLRGQAPQTVLDWLDTPTRTRVIGPRYEAERDASHSMAGGPFRGWFDAVVHTQEVTPIRSFE
jgi:erythromycin esterase